METVQRSEALVRSQDDRVVAGVCGGLAAYLGTEPAWVRLGFVVGTVVWGLGLILYAILWITLQEEAVEEGDEPTPPLATQNPRAVVGVVLLTLGLLILLWNVLAKLSLAVVIPALLVGVGIFLLVHRAS